MGKGKHIGAGRGGVGGGGAVVIISTSISTQIPKQKAAKKLKKNKKPKSAVNNTVNKLILDRRSCKKVHKKVRFGSPVFITSSISLPGVLKTGFPEVLSRIQLIAGNLSGHNLLKAVTFSG